MSKYDSSFRAPRVKLLAAALSLALPAAHAAGAGSPPAHGNAALTALMPGLSRLHTTLANYVIPAPKSSAPARAPMTRAIANLADSGTGSLREALSSAVDGDVIDLGKLHGRIVLSSPLETTAAVTIKGPGRDLLTLDGGGHGRVLQSAHSLTLSRVTIANGSVSPSSALPAGGCLLASGTLYLSNATVTNCHVVGSPVAIGGAIAVLDGPYVPPPGTSTPSTALLSYDTITNSTATATDSAIAGGVYARYAYVYNSTISGNGLSQANGTSAQQIAAGGGIAALANPSTGYSLNIFNSTISGNTLSASGGTYYDPVAMTTNTVYGIAAGGSVFGQYAFLSGATLAGNSLTANGAALGGGGIIGGYSQVILSSISQNTVSAGQTAASANTPSGGGGLINAGKLTLANSAITGNHISSACFACTLPGGGMASVSAYPVNVIGSTISGNSATTTGPSAHPAGGGIGAMYRFSPSAPVTNVTVTNSTISGNTLTGANAGHSTGAGVWVGGDLALNNSTVAFNTSDGVGGGITTGYSATTTYTTSFYSSIVSNNTAASNPSDVFSKALAFTITGSNDLVMTTPSANITLPGGTLPGDPLLQPLAFNGGPTKTHALSTGSTAIDAGAAPALLTTDQRGYARVVGTAADIGAYELDTDRIFTDTFGPLLQ